MILKTGFSKDKDLCKFRAGSELQLVNGHPNIGVSNVIVSGNYQGHG